MQSENLRQFHLSSPMREGVLCWYPFNRDSSVLDLSGGILTEMLKSRCERVITEESDADETVNYIVVIDPENFSAEALKGLYSCLNPNGRLLLAYENPFGLRYWSGKTSPKTRLPYDSLFGGDGRVSKSELQVRLKLAGFQGQKWYYPLTDHWFTSEVYSESYLPDERLNQRFVPYIENDANLKFDERPLYREIIRGGAFEFMCGAYLVEARVRGEDEPCPVDYAAVTAYRETPKRFATTVRNDGTVHKIPLHPDGVKRLEDIAKNHNELANLGVDVIPLEIKDNAIIMQRVTAPTLWDYWARKLANGIFDENEMFRQFDRIRDAIYKAAAGGKCFWELVPANCFYCEREDELVFFDQEYYWENELPELAFVRAIRSLVYSQAFKEDKRSESWLSFMWERYGLSERWDELSKSVDKRTYAEVFGNGSDPLKKETSLAAAAIKRSAERKETKPPLFNAVPGKLKEMGFRYPIIYGFGKRGKNALQTLRTAGIEPSAIVDRELAYSSIELIPEGTSADVIIVSVLADGDEIKRNLETKVEIPVYTLEELLGRNC